MKKGSDLVKETEETSPDLYKDLSVVKEGLVWFPATISIPEKGMVFIDGTDKRNWSWKAARAVRILEEEKDKNPQGQLYNCLLYTSPSPRDRQKSRMPSSA